MINLKARNVHVVKNENPLAIVDQWSNMFLE
jgi:hypothetical protein